MHITFKYIKEELLRKDTQLIRDWNLSYTMPGPQNLVLLNEDRQMLLSGAILAILNKLIDQEEAERKYPITDDELLSVSHNLRKCV